jgi:SAM-dependent methyltransferase
MLAHDMLMAEEAFYRDRYWEWIVARLRASDVDRSGRFLDAGCGPGRLSIPLAKEIEQAGGRLTGVDFVPELLSDARRYARDSGVSNAEFVESDVIEFLKRQPDATYSAALCIEVPFIVPDLETLLRELARVLRPGGLLVASFRTRYFLVLHGVAHRNWDLAGAVLDAKSGPLPGMGWQNRHSAADVLHDLSDAGFVDVQVAGVGNCSGIAGDPLAQIARPSKLSSAELPRLAEIERAVGTSHPDTGRYIVAAAIRSAA